VKFRGGFNSSIWREVVSRARDHVDEKGSPMNLLLHGCIVMSAFGQIDGTIEYPSNPSFGQTYTVPAKFECGTEQTGIYYELVATHGPFTADAENAGQYCETWSGGAGTVSKYTLACNLLYGLFGLNANWASEQITITNGSCQGCCTGPSCVIPKKYIHAMYSYSQKAYVVKTRQAKYNGLALGWSWVSGSDWAVTNPCESAYCVKKQRNNTFSCSQDNKNGTYEDALRTGAPAGCCP
jgi:hypothetical protein